jgi:hypothetical protein
LCLVVECLEVVVVVARICAACGAKVPFF